MKDLKIRLASFMIVNVDKPHPTSLSALYRNSYYIKQIIVKTAEQNDVLGVCIPKAEIRKTLYMMNIY